MSGILISIIASSFLVFAFSSPEIAQFKHAWWLLMTSLLLIRLLDLWWWTSQQKNTLFNGRKAIARFITGANITAVMWSLYVLFIVSNEFTSDIDLSTHIIIISAMAGGSATVLAGHKHTAMFYAFILLAPPSTALLLSGEHNKQMLGILGLLFSIVMLVIAKKNALFTEQAMLLKNENAVLVHQMEEQVEQRTNTIYELSNLDPLTNLFNRTAFLRHLRQELTQSQKAHQQLAVLFIDLDGFKKINDAIGHDTGDQVLKNTADRLQQQCANPKLLCRWGGDEFLIALNNTNQSSAITYAKKIIENLSTAYSFENNRLSVGATVGIAFYPEHADNEHSLIRLADTAMYAQKKRIPCSVGVFSEQLEKQIHRELRLKDGLSQAINKQQFSLVFQPILRSSDKSIVAFEALLRWQLEQEFIPPDEFISIAEQYGLIRQIGAWVLQQACEVASRWPAEQKLAVCVNVSVIQLEDSDFIDIVAAALIQSQLPAEQLHIEITESVFTSDTALLSTQIRALQKKGITVSIDDFGTGYSSLSLMQDLAVNIVKIDRSFVDRIDTNGYAIINAVMNIADSLKYEVVAEGIETKEQMHTLTDLGVDYLQGYYFSKPLSIEHTKQFIAQAEACPVTNKKSQQL
ncbi:putative bifunctional diguanylate cyclase/phosphodiesterase [Agarivorans sp. MS3-6]|uniref:putative bifunctional diguanylate cyclase/phosphodiesterase n=1 Tax=Agarivorans sp. TSD2052 TaxID=2937286 RepID=UPI00200C5988|nr:EAL domain-containing protein [Agarivorans sp. TSD2052]UPW19531.1 EAL domain-containing protein [Agarivorans sp. TSD2052]